MHPDQRLKAFSSLGNFLKEFINNSNDVELNDAISFSEKNNAWFTKENVMNSLAAIADLLEEGNLKNWLSNYDLSREAAPKKVGVIMAGNLPLVGFHDMLCVLMSNNIFIGKLSSQDSFLLPLLTRKLIELEPEFKGRIIFNERLKDIDMVIATGSNNTARYFEYYFGKYPHIIRKNRNSAAILNGDEAKEELEALGKDIFQYFGLGCRSVSKLYVPENFDFPHLFDAWQGYSVLSNHSKYFNNYEYQKAIFLVNRVPHFDTGYLLIREDTALASPIAVLYYEFYKTPEDLKMKIEEKKEEIQCVVSNLKLNIPGIEIAGLGQAQCPSINDYADGVDTMKFLMDINK